MPSYVPPKKATSFVFYTAFVDTGSRPDLKANPTIASGDFNISIDDTSGVALTANPAAVTGATTIVRFTVTGAEMDGDTINILCVDAAGGEWDDQFITIHTAANLNDDLAVLISANLTAINSNAVGISANLTAINSNATSIATVAQLIVASGTVETSGSNSSTQVQTTLAEATDSHYDVMTILFTSGDEAGQSRLITSYTGGTGVVGWNAALTGTPADGVSFIILSAGTTADAVWDEILTGASHNISTSAGRRLRQIEEAFVHADGIIAGITSANIFTLDAGAVAADDYYVGDRLQITEGTGGGQSRIITAYTSGRVVTVDSDFVTNPDTSSLYEIDAADAHVPFLDLVPTQISDNLAAINSNAVGISANLTAINSNAVGISANLTAIGSTQARLPAALSGGNIKADALAISTSTAAADNLEASAEVIVTGAAEAGTLSTTVMTTDLGEATDEHYNGRIVIWTSGVLLGQASDITAYLGATGQLTYTAVTEAPSATDTFVIV